VISTTLYQISTSTRSEFLWIYSLQASGLRIAFHPPSFELDGHYFSAVIDEPFYRISETDLPNGITETHFTASVAHQPGLTLTLVIRYVERSPFIRFRYILSSKTERQLTKASGVDNLTYCSLSLADFPDRREVRFSEFNELFHSFLLSEKAIEQSAFENHIPFMGPIVAANGSGGSVFFAYEHGSQYPDSFLEFVPQADESVELRAVKGNYYDGQTIALGRSFKTLWMEAGAVDGDFDKLSHSYRSFQLSGVSTNIESRKPYIFYNTWNYQERNQAWNKKTYLESMTQERILSEIDVAHRMGVDVFVIDTGWYDKTGDWRVSAERFPNGLADVKAKLDEYGMKLGLWFNPTVAAVSSKMAKDHADCIRSWNGKQHEPGTVWETEASYDMCLVSRYADAFADELIRLNRELGVTYFKWDAIAQNGCSDPNHWHGNDTNSIDERKACYAFEIGNAMAHVVERLGETCPEAIVDFDITEGGRSVGLSFLSVGKYFLLNNGPYYGNYDIPAPVGRNINMFFYPGQARGWICRAPLTYDRWFPSILFLTHYFPDDTPENQWASIASLILGQNGIWGDLLELSDAGIETFGKALEKYKIIRDDITSADMVANGTVGGPLESYEKIAPNGRGVISLFSATPGKYIYISQRAPVIDNWHNEGVEVTFDSQGRAIIKATFNRPGAKLVMFGV